MPPIRIRHSAAALGPVLALAIGLPVGLAAAFGPAFAPPARAQDPNYKFLDYKLVRKAIPTMTGLSDKAAENGKRLHAMMDLIDTEKDPKKLAKVRQDVGSTLQEQLELKRKMVRVTKHLLKIYKSPLNDQQIFDKLHDTELRNIRWDNQHFKKCVQDVARALRVPIRLHHRVVQLNTVTFDFPRSTADTVLAWLCNGFDLRYVVQNGEIVVYKKITPTEERFIEYQKRHPEKKFKYWERQDAGGSYDLDDGSVGIAGTGSAQKLDLSTMDVDLLRDNMLKIWVIEESSELHNQRRIAEKSFKGLVVFEPTGDAELDRQSEVERQKNDKHLRHFLLLELDNSIEEIDICVRVLGENMTRDPEEAARRKLLGMAIGDINWRNKDLRAALNELGEKAGVPVTVSGIPKGTALTLDLLLEGATLETAIEMMVGIHYMNWKVEDGGLVFDYMD